MQNQEIMFGNMSPAETTDDLKTKATEMLKEFAREGLERGIGPKRMIQLKEGELSRNEALGNNVKDVKSNVTFVSCGIPFCLHPATTFRWGTLIVTAWEDATGQHFFYLPVDFVSRYVDQVVAIRNDINNTDEEVLDNENVYLQNANDAGRRKELEIERRDSIKEQFEVIDANFTEMLSFNKQHTIQNRIVFTAVKAKLVEIQETLRQEQSPFEDIFGSMPLGVAIAESVEENADVVDEEEAAYLERQLQQHDTDYDGGQGKHDIE